MSKILLKNAAPPIICNIVKSAMIHSAISVKVMWPALPKRKSAKDPIVTPAGNSLRNRTAINAKIVNEIGVGSQYIHRQTRPHVCLYSADLCIAKDSYHVTMIDANH